MDVMQLRRMLIGMIGGGNVAQSKSGTVTGNGTKSIDLQIGFEPDVVIVDSGLSAAEAGYTGLSLVAIAKNKFTLNMLHNSDTDTSNTRGYIAKYGSSDGWGSSTSLGAYRNIASYSNGTLTITNVTANPSAAYFFINNQQYTWTAYKA